MRRLLIAGLLLLAGLLPSGVRAAPYFEFAPDFSTPLSVTAGTTVSQIFAPLNDRLAVIDLWLSTSGVPAGLEISVQNASGTTVASRTVALSGIADSAGGTRTSIVLPSQISVSGGDAYRLNITATGATVRLYRSASIAAVPGSGGDSGAAYQYGTAVVGDVEQGYSFKFALTEAAETTVPVVSSAQVTHPSIGQAVLNFNASEPVDVRVVYGTRSTAWTGQYTPCLPGITTCSVRMPVTPGTTYSYAASVKDSWGTTAVYNGSFTAIGSGPAETAGTPTATPTPTTPTTATPTPSSSPTNTPPPNDGIAPIIINPRILGVSPTSVTVAWTTDEAADSSVIMVGEGKYVFDPTLELEHFMTIGGLTPDFYYRMRLSSSDYWGNYSDVLIIFTTPLTSDPTETTIGSPTPTPSYTVVIPTGSLPPPASSSPTPVLSPSGAPTPTASSVSTGTPSPTAVAYPSTSSEPGIISWPAAGSGVGGYRIDIFDEFGNLITTITVGADVTSIPLPGGLPAGARIIVYANRDGAFEKVADPFTVTDRPYAPPTSSLLTSVLVFVGGGTLLAALIYVWVRERRKQRTKVDASISTGLGGGSRV